MLAVKLAYPGEELPEVLSESIDALVALQDPRTIELVAPYLDHPDPYLAVAAATGLATAGRERVVPLLAAALDRIAPEAKAPFIYALASIRAESAREAVRRLTGHPDPAVQAIAKELSAP